MNPDPHNFLLSFALKVDAEILHGRELEAGSRIHWLPSGRGYIIVPPGYHPGPAATNPPQPGNQSS